MTFPAPLQPSDVDLKGFYMPRHIERIRRSRAFQLALADPAAGFYMFNLWDESWHEVPAGSLENDDLMLAAAARCTTDEWKKRRKVALYNWVLCSDGRLYHPVVCEIAWAVWQDRLKAKWKNACDRIAKANKRAIEDAQRRGQTQHITTQPVPAFEVWVAQEYPASAARLSAPAQQPAPLHAAPVAAAADDARGPDLSLRQGGAVAEKPPPVAATQGVCRSFSALKYKDKDKISPPTPPCGEAASEPDTGQDWQRAADFAAYMAAVGQPDAPVRTSWAAWLDVVRGLPDLRLLLAQVAAWRRHTAQVSAERGGRTRPMGPARLLREGTLESFTEQAKALMQSEAADGVIAQAEQQHADAVRETWGGLFDAVAGAVGGAAVFMAWFDDSWPEQVGGHLVIHTPKTFKRQWIADNFQGRIAKHMGCEVEVRHTFEQRGRV